MTIRLGYYLVCDGCEEPAGEVCMPLAEPRDTLYEAIEFAVDDYNWSVPVRTATDADHTGDIFTAKDDNRYTVVASYCPDCVDTMPFAEQMSTLHAPLPRPDLDVAVG